MLGRPVGHDETLKAELAFKELVERVGVLASVAVVDLVV